MWNYSQKTIDHYLAPRRSGKATRANLVVTYGSREEHGECLLSLFIDDQGIIKDFGFEIFGSARAQASTSMLGELVCGRHIEFAASIREEQLARALGGSLPEDFFRLPLIGLEALRKAYGIWLKEQGDQHCSQRILCQCMQVPQAQVETFIATQNPENLFEIIQSTRAGSGCGSCQPDILSLFRKFKSTQEVQTRAYESIQKQAPQTRADEAKHQLELAKWQLIEDIFETEIRPALRLDGGNIELIELVDKEVRVRMQGACTSCASIDATLRYFVQDTLQQQVDPEIKVIQAV